MDVSSVHTPGGNANLPLGTIEVTLSNVNLLWNSAGPPSASTSAVARIDSLILIDAGAETAFWSRRGCIEGIRPGFRHDVWDVWGKGCAIFQRVMGALEGFAIWGWHRILSS